MNKRFSTALAALTAATLLLPAIASADMVAREAGIQLAQSEKAAPKRARRAAPDMTRQQYIDRATQAAGRRFDAMDANKDGKLTAQERRDYAKKMREQRQKRDRKRVHKDDRRS